MSQSARACHGSREHIEALRRGDVEIADAHIEVRYGHAGMRVHSDIGGMQSVDQHGELPGVELVGHVLRPALGDGIDQLESGLQGRDGGCVCSGMDWAGST